MKNKFSRVVVKVGSSSLTYDNGKLNLKLLDRLCRVIADLRNRGVEVVLVSSGAISVGVSKMGLPKRPSSTSLRQAAAAVGQVELMFIYDKFFSEYGQNIAQVLLTGDVMMDPVWHRNVVNTFNTLFDHGCLPIVNENDTVSTAELDLRSSDENDFSDNDALSAIVADITRADLLVIMSDIEGLYDSDPHKNPEAKLISRVEELSDEVMRLGGGAGSVHGTGGMKSKLLAARRATEAGAATLIVGSSRPENLYDIFEGKKVGTLFCARH